MLRWTFATIAIGVAFTAVGACRDFSRFRPLPDNAMAGGGGQSEGGGGAGGNEGGSGGHDGGSGGACGFIGALATEFDGDALDTRLFGRYANPGTTISVSDGLLRLDFPAAADGGIRSGFRYDARGRSVTLEIEETQLVGAQSFWFDVGGIDDYAEFAITSTQLSPVVEEEGVLQQIAASVPFDMDAHRFLRFREEAGTLHYEVSGDGVTFDELATYPSSTLELEFAVLDLGAFGDGEGAAGSISLRSIRADAPSPHCPVSSFVNDFDDGVVGRDFVGGYQNPGCSYEEADGRLRFLASSSAANQACAAATSKGYDLTGESVTVEVVTPNDRVAYWLYVGDSAGENYFEWDIDGGSAKCVYRRNGEYFEPFALPYDHGSMRYLRLREERGMLIYETSPDGSMFTKRAETPAPFDVTAVQVVNGVFAYATHDSDEVVEFDNLNLTP